MANETDARDQKPDKKGLFDDLSVAQVIAGALAAITSMLLASKIGIAGSVIGVGFGSAVSTIASQLYKKFLSASAEKLSELSPVDHTSNDGQGGTSKGKAVHTSTDASASTDAATVAIAPMEAATSASTTKPLKDLPTQESSEGEIEQTAAMPPVRCRKSNTPRMSDVALQEDATVILAHAKKRRDKRKFQRRAVLVALVSALLAVAVYALLVDTITDGQGIGTKASVFPTTQLQDSQVGDGSTSESFPSAPNPSDSKENSGNQESDSSSDEASKDDASSSPGEGSAGSSDEGKTDTPTDSSGDKGTGSGSGSDNTGSDSDESSGTGSSSESGSSTSSGSGSGTKPGTDSGQGAKSEGSLGLENKTAVVQ